MESDHSEANQAEVIKREFYYGRQVRHDAKIWNVVNISMGPEGWLIRIHYHNHDRNKGRIEDDFKNIAIEELRKNN